MESSHPGPYATLRLFIWAPARGEDLCLPMRRRGPLTISSPPSARPFSTLSPPGSIPQPHPGTRGAVGHGAELSPCQQQWHFSHHILPSAAPSAGKQSLIWFLVLQAAVWTLGAEQVPQTQSEGRVLPEPGLGSLWHNPGAALAAGGCEWQELELQPWLRIHLQPGVLRAGTGAPSGAGLTP